MRGVSCGGRRVDLGQLRSAAHRQSLGALSAAGGSPRGKSLDLPEWGMKMSNVQCLRIDPIGELDEVGGQSVRRVFRRVTSPSGERDTSRDNLRRETMGAQRQSSPTAIGNAA
ncbi:unnamed protein product, partial [Iphiclides podalirius]